MEDIRYPNNSLEGLDDHETAYKTAQLWGQNRPFIALTSWPEEEEKVQRHHQKSPQFIWASLTQFTSLF
jgi:hypothetical protein